MIGPERKRSWFLSYNSLDAALTARVEAALRAQQPDLGLFYAPKSLQAGGYWLPTLADEIAAAEAFVLLVAENGLGPWQVLEYYEALDRRVKEKSFPVVLVLLDGQAAPGLPFLRQLHWIVAQDPASDETLGRLAAAVAGHAGRPHELWRHTAPYRGLLAMTEADSDYFFGRQAETVEVLRALAEHPDRLPVLLGNSGVGKSSLAQAGVLAALKRQAWPEGASGPEWSTRFAKSRGFCFLSLRPGTAPLDALVKCFHDEWQVDSLDPKRESIQAGWVAGLLDGTSSLKGLIDATQARLRELGREPPSGYLLYVDQGEELYVRAEESQRLRFSAVLAQGLSDPRLFALMSLRADFTGELQNDTPLYDAHLKIDVVPMREDALHAVVTGPAARLGAGFEADHLPADIARRAHEESATDAGALTLLSYLMEDMWREMVARGDGTLRLPAKSIELGRMLAERADTYLKANTGAEARLRRILTLKLASVRGDGEPTRRRALRSEFTDEEWRLVSELADHPHRILVTARPERRETYAEVAHEAIFRRWGELRDWIGEEREFLSWKSALEGDRQRWEAMEAAGRDDALLRGLALAQAEKRLAERAEDLAAPDRKFIAASIAYERDLRDHAERQQKDREREKAAHEAERERERRLRGRIMASALTVALLFAGFAGWRWLEEGKARIAAVGAKAEALEQRNAAERARADVLQQKYLADAARISAESQKSEAERLRKLAEANEQRAGEQANRAEQQSRRADLRAAEAEKQSRIAEQQSELAQSRQVEVLKQKEVAETEKARAENALSLGINTVEAFIIDLVQKYEQYGVPQPVLQAMLEKALALQSALASGQESDPRLQRSRSVGLGKLGDLRMAQADLAGALTAYEEAKIISEKLASSEPSNSQAVGDFSITLDRIGDVRMAQGDLTEALKAYEVSKSFREKRTTAEPSNAGIARDLAISLSKIGEVLIAQGDLVGALKVFEECHAILEKVAVADPSDSQANRGVAMSLFQAARVLLKQGDLPGSIKAYEAGRAIVEKRAASDPGSKEAARDLALSLGTLGDIRRAQGDLAHAFDAYEKMRSMSEKSAASDPSSAHAALDLANDYKQLGLLLADAGYVERACRHMFLGRATLLAYRERSGQAAAFETEKASFDRAFAPGLCDETALKSDDLGGEAYHALEAKDFAKALTLSDEAITLKPDRVWLHTNRAHALMLLGRTNEARALYLAYLSQIAQDDTPWEKAVTDDFAHFRKLGITDPLMDEIEKAFAAASTKPEPAQ